MGMDGCSARLQASSQYYGVNDPVSSPQPGMELVDWQAGFQSCRGHSLPSLLSRMSSGCPQQ